MAVCVSSTGAPQSACSSDTRLHAGIRKVKAQNHTTDSRRTQLRSGSHPKHAVCGYRAVARVDRSRPHSTEADIVYDALNVLAACVTLGGASQASVLLDTQKLRSQFDKHAFARRAVQECGDVEDPGSTRRVVVLVIVAAALVFINWCVC